MTGDLLKLAEKELALVNAVEDQHMAEILETLQGNVAETIRLGRFLNEIAHDPSAIRAQPDEVLEVIVTWARIGFALCSRRVAERAIDQAKERQP